MAVAMGIGRRRKDQVAGSQFGSTDHLPGSHTDSGQFQVPGQGQAVDAHAAEAVGAIRAAESEVRRTQDVRGVFSAGDRLVSAQGESERNGSNGGKVPDG